MVKLSELAVAVVKMAIGNRDVTSKEVVNAGTRPEWMINGQLEKTTVFELPLFAREDVTKSNLELQEAHEAWQASLAKPRESRQMLHDQIRAVSFGSNGEIVPLTQKESELMNKLLACQEYDELRILAKKIKNRLEQQQIKSIRSK